MEEDVGKLWHRLVTRVAATEHTEAAVRLEPMTRTLGILFRALGGDGGLEIKAADATEHGARRGWLQRMAGSHQRVELAWRAAETLFLPARLALFPTKELNRDLYLWLAAMAALDDPSASPHPGPPPQGGRERDSWLSHSQSITQQALARYPGLAPLYQRLLAAQLALRPDPAKLSPDEAAQELAVRAALSDPGSIQKLPPAKRPPQPVYLWLHPDPPRPGTARTTSTTEEDEESDNRQGKSKEVEDKRKRTAEQVEMPDGKKGLVAVRMENIFTWAEFVRVDRTTDEDEELEKGAQALSDMDHLSIARDSKRSAARLKFDLDLPSEEQDDIRLTDGILYPEWDWKKGKMLPDHCRVQPMVAREAPPTELPQEMRRLARRLRAQFEALAPVRVWYRGQPEGSDVDLDAYLEFLAERRAGHHLADDSLYRELRGGGRDLACLLLADLSLSTDAWINNEGRVIDVIRDALLLFAEALSSTGDRFALFGFSSKYRSHVRFHLLKAFSERWDRTSRGRVQAIRPGYYTRMGAAIRHATDLLARQPAHQRLLLLVTDGKPNDLDRYEGRHGAEDTRMAIIEAKRRGLTPFCVTIDRAASDYLPHLFGPGGFLVIRHPEQLPRQLPMLYARLTRGNG